MICLVIGIDPGITVGLAALELNWKPIAVESKHN